MIYKAQPIVDSHIHLFSAQRAADLKDVVGAYGASAFNIVGIPQSRAFLAQNAAGLAAKAMYSPRAYFFGGLSYHFPGVARDKLDLAGQAAAILDAGADGIKMLEGKPTVRKDIGIAHNDPIYDDFYRIMEHRQVPMTFHVADPEEFWDESKAPAFARTNGWLYTDGTYVSKEQLYEETFSVLQRFPRLKVTFAHFFFLSADLRRAADLLDRYPGVCLDITPGVEMYENFSRRGDDWRQFFMKYSDRIIFGTDNCEKGDLPGFGGPAGAANRVKAMLRFLASADTFEGMGFTLKGLALPGEALANICRENFLRRTGAAPKPIDRPKALALIARTAQRIKGLPNEVDLLAQLDFAKGRIESITDAPGTGRPDM
jgi:predicted TIM-barrel fold metal-dependent hydrolase